MTNNVSSFSNGKGTVEAWIAPSRKTYNYIFDANSAINGSRVGLLWQVNGDNAGAFLYNGGNYAYGWNNFYFSTASWNLNDWHHIVFSWDKDLTGNNMFLYGDGKLMNAVAGNVSYFPNAAASIFYLARYYSSNSYNLQGKMDDVRVYNYVRTAEQIKVDYNDGVAAHLK